MGDFIKELVCTMAGDEEISTAELLEELAK